MKKFFIERLNPSYPIIAAMLIGLALGFYIGEKTETDIPVNLSSVSSKPITSPSQPLHTETIAYDPTCLKNLISQKKQSRLHKEGSPISIEDDVRKNQADNNSQLALEEFMLNYAIVHDSDSDSDSDNPVNAAQLENLKSEIMTNPLLQVELIHRMRDDLTHVEMDSLFYLSEDLSSPELDHISLDYVNSGDPHKMSHGIYALSNSDTLDKSPAIIDQLMDIDYSSWSNDSGEVDAVLGILSHAVEKGLTSSENVARNLQVIYENGDKDIQSEVLLQQSSFDSSVALENKIKDKLQETSLNNSYAYRNIIAAAVTFEGNDPDLSEKISQFLSNPSVSANDKIFVLQHYSK